jgi:N-acetyl-alpha-D-muramate 1-phosphate uridylyltransferase
MSFRPETAMVLAAGLGTRMRPLDPAVPKPLVRVGGRALIDHVLDRLADAGIGTAAINVHHEADRLEAHVRPRTHPRIVISDERDRLLDTGGGVKRAFDRGLLGDTAFLVHNSDSIWLEPHTANLPRLCAAWDKDRMECLMLLADPARSLGYAGRGDFDLDAEARVSRPIAGARAAYVFAGVSVMHPRLLAGAPEGAFSLNLLWNGALAARRVHGVVLEGTWMHVGDPAAHAAAEQRLTQAAVR